MIEAFAADRANHTFDVGALPSEPGVDSTSDIPNAVTWYTKSLRGDRRRIGRGWHSHDAHAPACPAAQFLPGQVRDKVAAMSDVTDVQVDVVWDPPRDRNRMSEAAKLQFGMF